MGCLHNVGFKARREEKELNLAPMCDRCYSLIYYIYIYTQIYRYTFIYLYMSVSASIGDDLEKPVKNGRHFIKGLYSCVNTLLLF